MRFWNIFSATLWGTLWFSWVALIFAAIPAGIAKLVLSDVKIPKRILVNDEKAECKAPFFRLGLLGGIAGEFVAISSLFIGEWWICKTRGQLCYDGQGGMALVVTIPALSVIGSVAAIVWTWFTLRIPTERLGASIFAYTGPSRGLNWSAGFLLTFGFWCLLWLVAYRVVL